MRFSPHIKLMLAALALACACDGPGEMPLPDADADAAVDVGAQIDAEVDVQDDGVRDVGCTVNCGRTTPTAGTLGSACEATEDCTSPNARCHRDPDEDEPLGWVEGYCLQTGCETLEDCATGGACVPTRVLGANVCMLRCETDADCRSGYICRSNAGESVCHKGCDDGAECPPDYTCAEDRCISDLLICSSSNLSGWCADGTWCDDGACAERPFDCASGNDLLEPNDSLDAATQATGGVTSGLRICAGDEDWFRVVVAPGKLVRVEVAHDDALGDLDLVAYAEDGSLLGARLPHDYPYLARQQETDWESFGVVSIGVPTTYLFRVVGHLGAVNAYELRVVSYDYADGPDCVVGGWSERECHGLGPNGAELLPFPFPEQQSTSGVDNYSWDTFSNYRFVRREMIMVVRHALEQTSVAFPGTGRVGLGDGAQRDGATPGVDVGDPRHPATTHNQGGNLDIAYFQTDGDNDLEVICGDGTTSDDDYCSAAAASTHIVDLPRQAYFMAKLLASDRLRVIGVDRVLDPLIRSAAVALGELPANDPQHLSAEEVAAFDARVASSSGWSKHHHHIHVSMMWWPPGDVPPSL